MPERLLPSQLHGLVLHKNKYISDLKPHLLSTESSALLPVFKTERFDPKPQMALDHTLSLQHFLCPWHSMWGAGLPTALDPNSNKWQKGKGESRTGKSDRCKPVGSAVLHGHGQRARKEGGISSRERRGCDGIKNINSCVAYCVQGLKISVCCWQRFYGGFW